MPFSAEQFFDLFRAYNAAIWPAQLAAYVLGVLAVGMLWARPQFGKPAILTILAMLWAWNGMAYQGLFFAAINPAARLFAVLFVLQAILFAASAVTSTPLRFHVGWDGRTLLAAGLIVYALLIYEVLGYLAGHELLDGPLFGVAPCPTTIFTIGILVLARGALIVWLSVIPVAWAVLGTSAAVLLGVPQDLGLAAAAVILLGALATDHWRTIRRLAMLNR